VTKRNRQWFRPAVEGLEGRLVPTPLTIAVNTTQDLLGAPPGVVSLREAIRRANANPGPDTILLPAGTYTITRAGADNTNAAGDFDVSDPDPLRGSLTIVGQGTTPGATIIQGNPILGLRERLFDVLGKVDMAFVNLTLRNGGNGSSFGGAVQALTANITLTSCVVSGNFGSKGGAINAEAGKVTLRNCLVAGNSTTGDGNGGAVFAGSGGAVLENSTLRGNSAGAGRGGAVFVQRGDVAVSHSTLSLNIAGNGGAIDDEAGNVSLRNGSVVQGNTADGSGGGIFDRGTVTLSGSSVLNNTSENGDGGGIDALAVNATGSTVSGNSAGDNGGGIFADTETLVVSAVNGNSAKLAGGGICSFGTVTLVRSTVSGNAAHGDSGFGSGGGIRASTANVTDSTISSNRSTGIDGGGGLFAGVATLVRSTVSGNAGRQGGGLRANTVSLTNTTVSGNSLNATGSGNSGFGFGGGVAAAHGTILNCTIVENVATAGGGGLIGQGTTDVIHVKNTIIAGNFVQGLGTGVDVSGTFVSEGHNLIGVVESAATGFGAAGDQLGAPDAPLDPRLGPLQNNGGPTQTHALLAGSPAIDHGSSAGGPATDQRGAPRPLRGISGNVVDIGAFEK
jgi:predicted outer membrane repeat protein